MLHEAIVRVLNGSRVWPFGVPILAVLSGVTRSIRDDYRRRVRHEPRLGTISGTDRARQGAMDELGVLAACKSGSRLAAAVVAQCRVICFGTSLLCYDCSRECARHTRA
ncbi:hypothetical protein BRAS3843_1310027 [Bradyrhizobium sp. STM 3843]|nr:hypothetical protein BRAS3843_1310027 [Bradyrhizobium sp. STM 3843]